MRIHQFKYLWVLVDPWVFDLRLWVIRGKESSQIWVRNLAPKYPWVRIRVTRECTLPSLTPAPVPLSRCAARLWPPGRRNAPVPVPAAATVSLSLSPNPNHPGPTTPLPAGPEGALLTHCCGNFKMNPLTCPLASSGNAPPAYLDTTSTTCWMVCTISRRTSVSLHMCSSEMGGRREVDTELLLGRGWRLAMKSRKIKIWASMCAVVYYFF